MSIKRTFGAGPVSPVKPAADSNGAAAAKVMNSRVRSASPDPALPARGSAVGAGNRSKSKRTTLPKAGKLQLTGTHSQQVLDKANDVAVRGLDSLYRALHKGSAA